MTSEEMKGRTKQFALRIVRLVNALPKTRVAGTISGQLLRAGTSVGSNYRAACRARSMTVSSINTARGGPRARRKGNSAVRSPQSAIHEHPSG